LGVLSTQKNTHKTSDHHELHENLQDFHGAFQNPHDDISVRWVSFLGDVMKIEERVRTQSENGLYTMPEMAPKVLFQPTEYMKERALELATCPHEPRPLKLSVSA
jgi:hypothetical protein